MRVMGIADCGAGLMLLARPSRVAELAAADGRPPDARIVRLLGLRLAAQGVLQLAWPSPTASRLAAAIDGTHAASMVAVAAWVPTYRRPALVSATLAAGSSVLEVLGAANARPGTASR